MFQEAVEEALANKVEFDYQSVNHTSFINRRPKKLHHYPDQYRQSNRASSR